MGIQLLRPESVTPIASYLERSAAVPASFQPQFDLAAALLYREGEYRAMFLSSLHVEPRPRDESPFVPYDLTHAAAEILNRALRPGPDVDFLREAVSPDDLFGLKNDVAARLASVLRPVQAHRMGWVLAARLWHDLCRYGDAIRAGEQAADLGASQRGLALARSAALVGAHMAAIGATAIAVPGGERIADAIEARAAREGLAGRGDDRWRAADRALDDWLRKTGVAVRRRVEGQSFERFMTSESDFCDGERRAAMASFDLSAVPPELRHLAPLAQSIGVGDDVCRGVFLRKMTKAKRRQAAAQVRNSAERIDQWLDGLAPPHEGAAAAFYWLRIAAEEIASD